MFGKAFHVNPTPLYLAIVCTGMHVFVATTATGEKSQAHKVPRVVLGTHEMCLPFISPRSLFRIQSRGDFHVSVLYLTPPLRDQTRKERYSSSYDFDSLMIFRPSSLKSRASFMDVPP